MSERKPSVNTEQAVLRELYEVFPSALPGIEICRQIRSRDDLRWWVRRFIGFNVYYVLEKLAYRGDVVVSAITYHRFELWPRRFYKITDDCRRRLSRRRFKRYEGARIGIYNPTEGFVGVR